jgi:hypothetical protein
MKHQDEEEQWPHHVTTEEEQCHLGTTLAGMRKCERTKLAPRDYVPKATQKYLTSSLSHLVLGVLKKQK